MPNFKQHKPKLTAEELEKKAAATGRLNGLVQNALDWERGEADAHNPPPFAWGLARPPKRFNPSQHLDLHGAEAREVNRYLFAWAKHAYEQTIYNGRNKANIRSLLDTIWVEDPERRKKAKASLAGSLDKVIDLVGVYADVSIRYADDIVAAVDEGQDPNDWEEPENKIHIVFGIDEGYGSEYWTVSPGANVGYLERLMVDVMEEVELAPDTFAKIHLLSERLKQHVHRIDSGDSPWYLRSYSEIRKEWVIHLAIVWREFLGQMPKVHSYEDDSKSRRDETNVDDVSEDDERVLSKETEHFLIFVGSCCYIPRGDENLAGQFAEHILDPIDMNQAENRVRHALRGFNPLPPSEGPPW